MALAFFIETRVASRLPHTSVWGAFMLTSGKVTAQTQTNIADAPVRSHQPESLPRMSEPGLGFWPW